MPKWMRRRRRKSSAKLDDVESCADGPGEDIRDGFLRIVKDHAFRQGKATEFRFDVSRFSLLAERAQKGCAEAFGDTNGSNGTT